MDDLNARWSALVAAGRELEGLTDPDEALRAIHRRLAAPAPTVTEIPWYGYGAGAAVMTEQGLTLDQQLRLSATAPAAPPPERPPGTDP